MPPGQSDITRVLTELRDASRDEVLDRLVPVVYDELHGMAEAQLRRASRPHPPTHRARSRGPSPPAIPNTEDTGRDQWVKMAHLIRGARGPEHEAEGLELFQEWAAGWQGNNPEENERVYMTARPKAGWHALQEWADRCGVSLKLEAA